MELKKPAIPSKLFKPTAELKQIESTDLSHVHPRTLRIRACTINPNQQDHRRGLWIEKVSVNHKLTRASNYTPTDPTLIMTMKLYPEYNVGGALYFAWVIISDTETVCINSYSN